MPRILLIITMQFQAPGSGVRMPYEATYLGIDFQLQNIEEISIIPIRIVWAQWQFLKLTSDQTKPDQM